MKEKQDSKDEGNKACVPPYQHYLFKEKKQDVSAICIP